jgi:phosphoglycerol transferase MdoB-like AlkP superfamily enzyme
LDIKEKEEIESFLSKYMLKYTDNQYAVKEKQNLIVIIVESLNSWLINFKLDSIEVTPHLNQLCQENNSILLYIYNLKSKVVDQVMHISCTIQDCYL